MGATIFLRQRVLETGKRPGILALGLDPGMGMPHSGFKGRDPFVYDVIEPLRSASMSVCWIFRSGHWTASTVPLLVRRGRRPLIFGIGIPEQLGKGADGSTEVG
jgi:hypothetical protein